MKRSSSNKKSLKTISCAAKKAWTLWNDISDFADRLWDDYENDFIQLAMMAAESYKHKPIADNQYDLPF